MSVSVCVCGGGGGGEGRGEGRGRGGGAEIISNRASMDSKAIFFFISWFTDPPTQIFAF